jgi:hypothetical protein
LCPSLSLFLQKILKIFFCHAFVATIGGFRKCKLEFHEKMVCEQKIRWKFFCVDMHDQKLKYGIKNKKFGHKNVEKERE